MYLHGNVRYINAHKLYVMLTYILLKSKFKILVIKPTELIHYLQ